MEENGLPDDIDLEFMIDLPEGAVPSVDEELSFELSCTIIITDKSWFFNRDGRRDCFLHYKIKDNCSGMTETYNQLLRELRANPIVTVTKR